MARTKCRLQGDVVSNKPSDSQELGKRTGNLFRWRVFLEPLDACKLKEDGALLLAVREGELQGGRLDELVEEQSLKSPSLHIVRYRRTS